MNKWKWTAAVILGLILGFLMAGLTLICLLPIAFVLFIVGGVKPGPFREFAIGAIIGIVLAILLGIVLGIAKLGLFGA